MERDKERVLNVATIKEVVQMFCPGVQINRQNRCACPIHGGTHDSMKIYENTNSFYCFACGAAGDPIKFVAELHGTTYRQATKEVGAAFGVNVQAEPTAKEIKRMKEIRRRQNALAELDKKEAAALKPHEEQREDLITDIIGLQATLQDIANRTDLWEYHAELSAMLEETLFDYDCTEAKIAEIKEQYEKTRRIMRGENIARYRPKTGGMGKRKKNRA